jgi:glutathione synthase/RimK-type ligase-like ATP-grasp enzyme
LPVSTRLAWVTARQARGQDEDEPLAVGALRAAGLTVEVVDWDGAGVDWASYDRVVVRSTWDYAQRLPQFLDWLEVVDRVTDLRNPLSMIRWGLDKHYLADLAAAGVPITPTAFAEPDGEAVQLPAGGVVVKPAVGAGSRDAASYGEGQAELVRAHVQRLHHDGRSVLVQPLLASVLLEGEWPLVFFDGRYSHGANRRVTLPRTSSAGDRFAAHDAGPAQVAVAQAAIDVVTARFGTPTYARVDLVRDGRGRFCVLELETAEPALFLPLAGPQALDRLIDAFRP